MEFTRARRPQTVAVAQNGPFFAGLRPQAKGGRYDERTSTTPLDRPADGGDGRASEAWGAESGTDRLVVVRSR
jgi:hypothetical protein